MKHNYVPRDDYAAYIPNVLNYNKTNKITYMPKILKLLGFRIVKRLPNCWWSDDGLAVIVDYYKHDT